MGIGAASIGRLRLCALHHCNSYDKFACPGKSATIEGENALRVWRGSDGYPLPVLRVNRTKFNS